MRKIVKFDIFFEELTIADNFIFCKVMQNAELCKDDPFGIGLPSIEQIAEATNLSIEKINCLTNC